jgi:5-methylcytosine-specific restriction endonuclease McrA
MDKPKSKIRPWQGKLKRPMQDRSRVDFYHQARWTRESRLFRELHPFCTKCAEEGVVHPSEVTDHKVPLVICEDPWDWNNWDAICRRHNNIKAAQDKKLIQLHKKQSK